MQTVDLNNDHAPCSNCGADLVILGSFTHCEIKENTEKTKNEICRCNICGGKFILQYNFFDSMGHINSFVFSGDVNDPAYNWQDQLTTDQKNAIGKHLKECSVCNHRLDNEITSDAWLASLIHN
jgi:hypothetical protein